MLSRASLVVLLVDAKTGRSQKHLRGQERSLLMFAYL